MPAVPLAELIQADLDPATLDALFTDLAALCDVREVTLKGAADHLAGTTAVTLAEAQAALTAGRIRGAQIRYGYQGEVWWDTLLRLPQGVRLVRMRAPW
jgi:hypothetical protein